MNYEHEKLKFVIEADLDNNLPIQQIRIPELNQVKWFQYDLDISNLLQFQEVSKMAQQASTCIWFQPGRVC